MNNNNKLNKMIIYVEGILLIILVVIVYYTITEHNLVLLAGAEICLMFIIFTNLRGRYIEMLNDTIKVMSDAMNDISNANNEYVYTRDPNKNIGEFYDNLDILVDNLKKRDDTRQEILNIVNTIAINTEFDKMLEDIMPKLLDVTRSNCGAFYLANNSNQKLELKHSMGFSKNIYKEFDITLGEGFIGRASLSKEAELLTEIPDDTAYIIKTFMGKIKPKNILVVPLFEHEILLGVLVFASIFEYKKEELEIIEIIKYYAGVAISNGVIYEKTKRLTNELQFQNKLIRDLNEELEKNVKQRTLYLENMIDSVSTTAMLAIDKDFKINIWNSNASKMFGYSSENAIDKKIFELKADIGTKDFRKKIDFAFYNGEHFESMWFINANGEKFYAELTIKCLYDSNNEKIGLTIIIRDRTEKHELEQAVIFQKAFEQKILDSSGRPLIITDKDGNIEVMNTKAEKLLYKENAVGEPISNFFVGSMEIQGKIAKCSEMLVNDEWECTLRSTNEKFIMNANSFSEKNTLQTKLYIYLT